jgi:hypothetical protein
MYNGATTTYWCCSWEAVECYGTYKKGTWIRGESHSTWSAEVNLSYKTLSTDRLSLCMHDIKWTCRYGLNLMLRIIQLRMRLIFGQIFIQIIEERQLCPWYGRWAMWWRVERGISRVCCVLDPCVVLSHALNSSFLMPIVCEAFDLSLSIVATDPESLALSTFCAPSIQVAINKFCLCGMLRWYYHPWRVVWSRNAGTLVVAR